MKHGKQPPAETGGLIFPVLFSTSDQTSVLILFFLSFLLKEPGNSRHSATEAEEQQPDQRTAVITGFGVAGVSFFGISEVDGVVGFIGLVGFDGVVGVSGCFFGASFITTCWISPVSAS